MKGYFKDDELVRGSLKSELGELIGEFKDGMAEGYGTFTSTDKDLNYEGIFSQDSLDGVGRKKCFQYEYIG